MQRPQIQHRLVDAPFATCASQLRQHRLTGLQIKMALCAQPDKFLRPDDLKLSWHVQKRLNTTRPSLKLRNTAISRPKDSLLWVMLGIMTVGQ